MEEIRVLEQIRWKFGRLKTAVVRVRIETSRIYLYYINFQFLHQKIPCILCIYKPVHKFLKNDKGKKKTNKLLPASQLTQYVYIWFDLNHTVLSTLYNHSP